MIADVVWGGLDFGEMAAGAFCGVLGVDGLVVGAIWGVVVADAHVSNADWVVLFMGRLVTVALVGDVVWGVLGFDGMVEASSAARWVLVHRLR